jgi:hypothetical protein
MKILSKQAHEAYIMLQELAEIKLPFKASLIISRNLKVLQKESEFYVEQEQNFVKTYLEFDQETGMLIQSEPGAFKIQEGKAEECYKARQELDAFEVDVDIKKIPCRILENIELTPA